jgi:hypothetical protein
MDARTPDGPGVVLPHIDTTKPNVARLYDLFLGGKDGYEADREIYRRTLEIDPEAPLLAQSLRKWLIRVVRYLSGTVGLDQFLDCGSGLPTSENTHQVAQRMNSEATVVYVDNDPVVIAHGRALLADNEQTHFVPTDLRRPEELFAHPVVQRYLDLNRPLALIQCSTIHHIEDHENPKDLMARYIDALPSGSYLALSHFCDPADGSKQSELARVMEANLRDAVGSGRCRTYDEIRSFFGDMELIEPGLVRAVDWWPDGPRTKPLPDILYIGYGAVARKP